MSEEQNEVTTTDENKKVAVANPNLPAFMQQDGVAGTENLDQYIRPPMMKIIQKMSADELVDQFGVGTVIVQPQSQVLAGKEQPLLITPLFQFTEWVVVNPIQLKDLPSIHDRTIDPKSPIAVKAKNRNTWYEDIPGRINEETGNPWQRRNVENINFVCMVHNVEEVKDTPVVFSFSKGRWRDGSDLCMKIRQRKAPIYGCVFELTSVLRENASGNFWGQTVANPTQHDAFIQDEEQYKLFKELHEKFDSLHGEIEVTYDDPKDDDPVIVDM